MSLWLFFPIFENWYNNVRAWESVTSVSECDYYSTYKYTIPIKITCSKRCWQWHNSCPCLFLEMYLYLGISGLQKFDKMYFLCFLKYWNEIESLIFVFTKLTKIPVNLNSIRLYYWMQCLNQSHSEYRFSLVYLSSC